MANQSIAPASLYVAAGPHEIHVTAWGNAQNPAVVMWHGLARTGRDFDEAAAALAERYFVLCPDTLGRGLSSWARDVAVDYSYASFGRHALAVLDHFGIATTRWVGTSMGGLLGVTLAAGPLKGRISHLAVNDIGPAIPQAASSRIAEYVGNPPVFRHASELEGWLRRNYAPFGVNTDAFWRRMTDTSCRRLDDGGVTVHYDPQIVTQFTLHKADLDCWPAWDGVDCPTLLIRGANSDVLPAEVAREMLERGPRPKFVEIADVGHAPTFANAQQIAILRDFLAK
jgi:pimeloyl-ACP methyl ester carboxylesterase